MSHTAIRITPQEFAPPAIIDRMRSRALVVGVVFGVLLSLPDAVVTKSYVPILIGGAVGGLVIGGITRGWH